MVYPYRLVLTDGICEFSVYDYGRSIPYKLYDQTETTFDASSYTGYIRVFGVNTSAEKVTEIASNANASGVGSFSFTSTNNLTENCLYELEWQGVTSGNVLSFRCDIPIAVYLSPSLLSLPLDLTLLEWLKLYALSPL